jgi:hypothetical protein
MPVTGWNVDVFTYNLRWLLIRLINKFIQPLVDVHLDLQKTAADKLTAHLTNLHTTGCLILKPGVIVLPDRVCAVCNISKPGSAFSRRQRKNQHHCTACIKSRLTKANLNEYGPISVALCGQRCIYVPVEKAVQQELVDCRAEKNLIPESNRLAYVEQHEASSEAMAEEPAPTSLVATAEKSMRGIGERPLVLDLLAPAKDVQVWRVIDRLVEATVDSALFFELCELAGMGHSVETTFTFCQQIAMTLLEHWQDDRALAEQLTLKSCFN